MPVFLRSGNLFLSAHRWAFCHWQPGISKIYTTDNVFSAASSWKLIIVAWNTERINALESQDGEDRKLIIFGVVMSFVSLETVGEEELFNDCFKRLEVAVAGRISAEFELS